MLKKLMLWLCVIVVVCIVTACASSGTHSDDSSQTRSSASPSPSGDTQPTQTKQITLEYWQTTFLSQDRIEALVAQYKNVEPNVDIKISWIPFNGIDERVNVAIASNTFPDVYMDGIQRLAMLADSGISADLKPYITSDFKLDDWNQQVLQMGTDREGALRSLYTQFSHYPLMINKSLFEQAGAPLPDESTRTWTRAAFQEAVTKIGSLGDDIYGFGLGAVNRGHDKFVDAFIYNDGDSWVNPEYSQMIYNSEQNKKNFEWLVQITNSEHTVPGTAGNDLSGILEMFKNGKVGIMSFNDGYPQELEKLNIDYWIVHPPTWDGSVPKSYVSAGGYMIKSQDDKDKEEAAAKFVLWLNAPDNKELQAIFKDANLVYLRKSAEKPELSPELEYYNTGMVKQSITQLFSLPHYGEMRDLWTSNFQAAFTNAKPPAQALDDFVVNAQKYLE